MQLFNENSKKNKIYSIILILIIFIVYIILRGYAWKQNIYLEDHDSITYMSEARMFLNLEFEKLKKISPDNTPFYPMMTAFSVYQDGMLKLGHGYAPCFSVGSYSFL
jgi:hypothetical protein